MSKCADQVVMARVASQRGMPWRDNFGVLLYFLGKIARADTAKFEELKRWIQEAEDRLSTRTVTSVQDLHFGDLTTIQVCCALPVSHAPSDVVLRE